MPITDNNGSLFYTLNLSKTYLQTFGTGFTPLSSFVGSEVLIVNRGSNAVNIYDNNEFNDSFSLILSAGESVTFKGISNTNQVSAKTGTGTTQLNYRVSRFSNFNQG